MTRDSKFNCLITCEHEYGVSMDTCEHEAILLYMSAAQHTCTTLHSFRLDAPLRSYGSLNPSQSSQTWTLVHNRICGARACDCAALCAFAQAFFFLADTLPTGPATVYSMPERDTRSQGQEQEDEVSKTEVSLLEQGWGHSSISTTANADTEFQRLTADLCCICMSWQAMTEGQASQRCTADLQAACRICRMGGESEPLFYPCKCSGTSFTIYGSKAHAIYASGELAQHQALLAAGSMRYVHQACLNQWLQHSGHKQCEASGNYALLPLILVT